MYINIIKSFISFMNWRGNDPHQRQQKIPFALGERDSNFNNPINVLLPPDQAGTILPDL